LVTAAKHLVTAPKHLVTAPTHLWYRTWKGTQWWKWSYSTVVQRTYQGM